MLINAKESMTRRVMIGIPMTGLVRSEWVMARYGQVIPCNWSQVDCIQWLDQYAPLGFVVADARNIIANTAVEQEFEWLFFIDHDTVLPPNTILKWNERMLKGDVPIFGGLYFTRSVPAEPLVYRGRGNSYHADWGLGEEVWVDGLPMGCTMIHSSILKALYEESEEYEIGTQTGSRKIKRIFETPARGNFDPEKLEWNTQVGTEDLEFCTRVMRDGIFKKAGWPEYDDKEFPFLIDTSVFCKHIGMDGRVYPSQGEEQEFIQPPVSDLGVNVNETIDTVERLN